MSISDIKSEVERMTLDERRQLTAYRNSLRHKELSGYREKLAEKIDDTDTDHWVSDASDYDSTGRMV